MPLPSNTELLSKYRIEAVAGEGAFGVVYRAWDERLDRAVAIKELRQDAEGMVPASFDRYKDRFRREVRVQAQFNHPHIVHVYDLLEQGDTLYLVMEFVDGPTLRDTLEQRGPLPLQEAAQITLDLLDALTAVHAHEWDIVHRDIKPSNVLIADGRAKLTDFGLAQLASESSRTQLDREHPGTPLYMSPEQGRSSVYLRPASDLYSVGCVLFEMLTAKVYKRVDDDPLALQHLRPDVPPALARIVAHATAEDLKERYRCAADFAAELRAWQAVSQNALTLMLAPDATLDFVRIPAGEFLMGSDPQMDPDALENEQPQRKVQLEAYWLSKHPVTNATYAAFVQATRHSLPRHWANGKIPAGEENHPVVNVSWEDAAAFCAWASQATGREVRLPTEAEWEKAARGADGRLYPWGNAAPDASRCNFGQHEQGTTPVGQYSPRGDSPYSCTDMAGNVWEWCADGYDANFHKSSSARNPQGPVHGRSRLLRGGSWYVEGRYVRCAHRFRGAPNYIFGLIGFRCAIGDPEKDQPQKRELWPVS